MSQQRQELHPKLANSKRHLVGGGVGWGDGGEDGLTLHPHVCRAWELEVIIFGLARRRYITVAGRCRSTICIKMKTGPF